MCNVNFDADALVRKYEPLIHSIISKKLPMYCGDEDLIQVGRVALWKSAKRYNPDRGKFSTYAYKSIYHAMLKELGKRKAEVSLNTPIAEDKGLELQDVLPNPNDAFCGSELRFELTDFLETITKRRKEILLRVIKGETRKEIAVALNVSYDLITKEMKEITNQWNMFHKKLEDEE